MMMMMMLCVDIYKQWNMIVYWQLCVATTFAEIRGDLSTQCSDIRLYSRRTDLLAGKRLPGE